MTKMDIFGIYHDINPLDSLVIENKIFESSSKFIWVTAVRFPQLHMFIHTNKFSKYTSGEHNF